MRYWIYHGNDAVGPYTEDELRSDGRFGPETLVCPDGAAGGNDWSRAKDRPEMGSLLRSLPARFWILEPDRSAKGPFDAAAMKRVSGLSPATLVCPVGAQDAGAWKPVAEIAELKSVLLPDAPAPEPAKPPRSIDFDFPKPAGFKPPPGAAPEPRSIDFDFPKPDGFKPPPGAPAEKPRSIDFDFPKPDGFKAPPGAAPEPRAIDFDFPKPPKPAASSPKSWLPSRRTLAYLAGSAALVTAAAAAMRFWPKSRSNAAAPAAVAREPAAKAPAVPAKLPDAGLPLRKAIDLVKGYPLPPGARRKAPTNLYNIGETSQKRWRPLRTVGEVFRAAPYRIAWQFCRDQAAATGATPEEIARQARPKIQEQWRGLDATYQVAWSANPVDGTRFQVEARVTDTLTSRLKEAFSGSGDDAGVVPSTESHLFVVDLDAKTVEAANPGAEADMAGGPDAPQDAVPPMDVPPKRASRPKKPKSPPPAAPAPADETPAPEPVAAVSNEPARTPAPKMEERPAAPKPAPPLPGISRSEPSRPKANEPSPIPPKPAEPEARKPSVKPATEMSVDELEKYLNRK
ncbi:MAG: hypothetical protein HY078_02125 [Elusimicrobia bacterium]|nr:hypothetical protein [Elusimicrobiota bacterium]